MKWLVIALVGIAIALAGCDKTPVAANPFPQATEVRLHINENHIGVDDNGKVSEGSFPKSGIELTPAEIRDIREAVHFAPPPDMVAACCVPRHAFLFYDKSHKLLGSLTVCFECSCARMKGGPTPPSGKTWIEWDEAVFAKVVRAHGQRTEFNGN